MNKKYLISWAVVFVVWMIGSFAVQQSIGDTALLIVVALVAAFLNRRPADAG